MEQSSRLLGSSSSLAALLLESSDSLLSPLGSHLCSVLALRKDGSHLQLQMNFCNYKNVFIIKNYKEHFPRYLMITT